LPQALDWKVVPSVCHRLPPAHEALTGLLIAVEQFSEYPTAQPAAYEPLARLLVLVEQFGE